jgi:predicted nucleic acid-binding protein
MTKAGSAIRELMTKHRLYASAVTLAEVLVGAPLDHHDEAVVRGFFADLVTEILPVEAADAERAARLRADHRSLRMPDALILAAPEAHPDVELLLTGDAAMAAVRGLDCRVSLLEPPA